MHGFESFNLHKYDAQSLDFAFNCFLGSCSKHRISMLFMITDCILTLSYLANHFYPDVSAGNSLTVRAILTVMNFRLTVMKPVIDRNELPLFAFNFKQTKQ
jgi:hypothetical protein